MPAEKMPGSGSVVAVALAALVIVVGIGLSWPVSATTSAGEILVAGTCGPAMAVLTGNAGPPRDVAAADGTDIGFELQPGRMEAACHAAAELRAWVSLAAGLALAAAAAAAVRLLRGDLDRDG